MVGLGLLLIIGVVVAVVFLGRRSHGPSASPAARPARPASVSADTEAVLARAVEDGLLTSEAADAIVTAELARRTPPVSPAADRERSVPPVAEAIGYVGSILVLVGMAVVVQRVWEDLTTAARLGIVGGAAALLFLVGLFLRDEADEVIWRLRGFVWLLSAGALAGFMAILTVDALEWEGEPVAVAIGAVVAAYSFALWQLEDRPAQQLTAFVGLLVMLGGMLASVGGPAAVGLMVLVVGASWLALGHRKLLPPELVALGLGSAAVLIGPAITGGSWEKPAPVIGLLAAVGLVAAGTVLHQFLVTGAGVVGLFVYVPWTLGALFGDAVGPPAILVASGVLLLVVMFVLLRRHGHDGGLGTGGIAPPRAAA